MRPEIDQLVRDEANRLALETILLDFILVTCAADNSLAEAMVGDLERLGTDRQVQRVFSKFASDFGTEASQTFLQEFREKVNSIGSQIAAGVPCSWNDI